MKCPNCNGKGGVHTGSNDYPHVRCITCDGLGDVTREQKRSYEYRMKTRIKQMEESK